MSDSITISEAKATGLIPDYLWDEIIDNCPTDVGGCDTPLVTSKNLKKQWCPNPRCRLKLAAMGVKMLVNFGFTEVGPEYTRKFFKSNPKYISHLGLFYATESELLGTGEQSTTYKFLSQREEVLKTKYTFASLVSKLSLPELESRALDVFDMFENYLIFKEYLRIKDISPVEYISELYGFGRTIAEKISNTLEIFDKDLSVLHKIFKIRPYAKHEYTIAMTGSPNFHYMSKNDFLKYLNRIGRDIVQVNLTKSAFMSCDYIVCASANDYILDDYGEVLRDTNGDPIIPPGSNKKNIGIMRNKTEGRKVLVSAEEMRDIVLESTRRLYDERAQ